MTDDAPRIPPLDPADAPEGTPPGPKRNGGVPLNIFLTLGKHPDLLKGFGRLGGALLQGTLPARERELVILRTGWRAGAEYEWGQHSLAAPRVGLSEDEVLRLAAEGSQGWSAEDAALVAAVDELCAGDRVSDGTWASLASRFDEKQLIELLVLVGFYRLVSGFLNSAGVQRESGVPGFPS